MAVRRLRWAGRLDMYRKIPADLMEGTRRGSALSGVALFVMVILFAMETKSFFTKELVTDLALDRSADQRLRLNFNITMMDMKCEYATVDIKSVLGTEQNVTAHVNKWDVSAEGVRQRYQGRNRAQKDIVLFDETVTETLEELAEDGMVADDLDGKTLALARERQEYVFVDFFASWCSHCQVLAPTYARLAAIFQDVAQNRVDEKIEKHGKEFSDEEYDHALKVELPVLVAKVDCVKHEDLCREQGIMAYPTLRLFVDGERWKGGDYRGDRTILAMTDYLKEIEDLHKSETNSTKERGVEHAHKMATDRLGIVAGDGEDDAEWTEKMNKRKRRLHHSWVDEDHPGCQLSGHLLLDRVPGNFHIQARSAHHDIVPHMTNVSHEIHSLSMGEPTAERMIMQNRVFVPEEVKGKITPMNGNVYITDNLHEAYHHYLKAITTSIDGLKFGRKELVAYQIIQSSQISFYREDVVPEAKFIFDLSPVAVSYRKTSRRWYDYITSVMAIVGGTFTVVGMLESSINAVVARKRRY